LIIDTTKRHYLAGTTSFDVFCVRNLFSGLGCSLIEEPQNAKKN